MTALIFLLPFLVAGVFAENKTTVTVSVYYESLCPDSVKFFLNRLIPTYNQTDYDFLTVSPSLKLIPFGIATKNNTNYTCQHGSSECDGNILHGCAITYLKDTHMLLNYIGCLMNHSLPLNSSLPYPDPEKVCTTEARDAKDNITRCYKGDEGKNMVDKFQDMTTLFFKDHTISVPFIAFNDTYDKNKSNNAQNDFRKTLCSEVGLNDNHCTDVPKSGTAMLSASFALISTLLFSFYATQ